MVGFPLAGRIAEHFPLLSTSNCVGNKLKININCFLFSFDPSTDLSETALVDAKWALDSAEGGATPIPGGLSFVIAK